MIPNFTQEPQLITVLIQDDSIVDRYPVGIGNTVLLLNFNSGKFWIKTNPNGFPQPPRSFTFNETTPTNIQNGNGGVSREEFNSLSQSVGNLTDQINKLVAELGGK